MHLFVTRCTQRDEVLIGVIPQLASRLKVMHLQVLSSSTVLAAPSVALKYLAAQPTIRCGLKP